MAPLLPKLGFEGRAEIDNGEHDPRVAHSQGCKEDPKMQPATGLSSGRAGTHRCCADAVRFGKRGERAGAL